MEKYTILSKIMSTYFDYRFIEKYLEFDNQDFVEQRLFSFLQCVDVISPENKVFIIKLIKEIFNLKLRFAIELLEDFTERMYLSSTVRPFSRYFIAQYGKSYINLYTKCIDTTINSRIAKVLLSPTEKQDKYYKFKITTDEILFISEGEEIE